MTTRGKSWKGLFALLVLLTASIVTGSEHINQLDAKEFQKTVLDSRDPFIVFFYDSDMIQQEEGHSALRDMETALQSSGAPYGIGYATLDCAAAASNGTPSAPAWRL